MRHRPPTPYPADRPPPDTPQPGNVIKRLSPGAPGTRRLLDRYGDALVCVRYREDQRGGSRYTTIELIVDRRPAKPSRQPPAATAATTTTGAPSATVLVRIDFHEAELRQRIKQAGATWNPTRRLWQVPRDAIRPLKLASRIVRNDQ